MDQIDRNKLAIERADYALPFLNKPAKELVGRLMSELRYSNELIERLQPKPVREPAPTAEEVSAITPPDATGDAKAHVGKPRVVWLPSSIYKDALILVDEENFALHGEVRPAAGREGVWFGSWGTTDRDRRATTKEFDNKLAAKLYVKRHVEGQTT